MEITARVTKHLREQHKGIRFGPPMVLFAAGLVSMYHSPDVARPTVLSWTLNAVATLPLIWRYRAPFSTLVTVTAALVWMEIAGFGTPGWGPVLVGAFTLTARREQAIRREGVLFWVGVVLVVTLGTILGEARMPALVSGAVLIALALVVGDNVRRRRTRAAELAEREAQAERERQLVAEQHVRDERSRIARELHDVVAHSVSVMVIQAAAARRQLPSNPQRASESMTVIEETGRAAMDEMRRLLGVLHDGQAPTDVRTPQPSLAMLEDLVRGAGDLPVALHKDGDLASLPSAVELSAYRIVQEALTNVRRHAGTVHRVDVTVARDGDALCVEVLDDGRGAAAVPAAHPGYGLVGMRERVSIFGGDLQAGPHAGGGWQVRATIPTAQR